MLVHTVETRVTRRMKKHPFGDLGVFNCVCKPLSSQTTRIIKVKKPQREPGHEDRVCCQQRKELWKRRSEKMRGKGRKDDKRANWERNLAGNESVAVWQCVLPTSGNARTGWHTLRICKRGFCSQSSAGVVR